MLPYLHWEKIQIGPITLYVWGIFVALGALLGLFLARRAAKRLGQNPELAVNAAFWMIVAGLIGGRLGYVFFYNPEPYWQDFWELFRIWNGGLSSVGGFLGAISALIIFVRRRRIDLIAISDQLAFGFPFGWAVGRIGCFLTHLHPGVFSTSFLAVQYPGGSRFDLGLIESLTGLLVGIILLAVHRFAPKKGAPTAAVLWSYLPIRFFSDFLRASDLPGSDVHIFGLLTPAQIGAAVILFVSLFWLPKYVRKQEVGSSK